WRLGDVENGFGEGVRSFRGQVVSSIRDPAMLARTREEAVVLRAVGRGEVAVGHAVERDRRNRDGRLLGEPSFLRDMLRRAGFEAEPVAVRVDDDVYVVGVLERSGGAVEGRGIERPGGG